MDGGYELAGVAPGQIGAAYGSGEEGVSSEEERLVGEIETATALGVAGGVEDGAGETRDRDVLTVLEVVVRG
ncbi:MAG: hypothetical protein JWQ42_2593 [Edaphobacter sp.]|nr:hypothetical protein [Edaphobacter sp.]